MDQKDVEFLAGQHVECSTNQALLSFKLVRDGCDGEDMRYEFKCGNVHPQELNTTNPACLIHKAYHSGAMVNSSAGGSSAKDCQQKCAALSTCNFWDWDGSTCRLRSDQGNGAQDASGFSAGRRVCVFQTRQTPCSEMRGQKLQSLKDRDVACGESQVMQSFKLVNCAEECACDGTVMYGRRFVFGKPGDGAETTPIQLTSHP